MEELFSCNVVIDVIRNSDKYDLFINMKAQNSTFSQFIHVVSTISPLTMW